MIREQVIQLDSRPVRCLEAGAGWPLVLLHAFPLSADMWRPQLDQPPRGWRVLAPDLRGFGPAANGGPASTLQEMAEDVVALLDALRIERAAIGGLSMGGYVTFALYRIAPERFSAMILANTRATADTTEAREARDRTSALVRTRGVPAVADEMMPRLLGETSRRTRPEVVITVRSLLAANRPDGIDGAIQAMKARPDSMDLLPRVAVPALVITGEEDTLTPVSDGEAMHRRLRRSQLVTLPRAGHLSNLENPADFSEAVLNFLQAPL